MKNKYLQATSVNILFFSLSAIFFLVVTPIALKIMGAEFYGLWIILNTLMLLSGIGNMGISAIIMKFSAETSHGDNEVWIAQVMTSGYLLVSIMAIITALLMLVFRNSIVTHIDTSLLYKTQLHTAIFWIALATFPQFLTRVAQGFLLSQLYNRVERILQFLSIVLLWSGAILLTIVRENLFFLGIWIFVHSMVMFVLYFGVTYRLIPYHFRLSLSTFKKMSKFSGFMFLQSLAIALFQQLDKVIVGFSLGPALAGVYSIGTSLGLRLSMVVGQASEVMIPYASLKKTLGADEQLYAVFRHLSRFISIFLAFISSLILLWMHDILSIWLSPDYANQYTQAFQILIIAYTFLSLSRTGHQTLTGVGRVQFSSYIYFFTTLLFLIGIYYFSRIYGILGAAVANLAMIVLLSFNLYVYQFFKKNIRLQDVIRDLGAGTITPVLIYLLLLMTPDMSSGYKLIVSIGVSLSTIYIIFKDDVFANRFKIIVHSLM